MTTTHNQILAVAKKPVGPHNFIADLPKTALLFWFFLVVLLVVCRFSFALSVIDIIIVIKDNPKWKNM